MFGKKKMDINTLVRQSQKAVCHPMEREIVVRKKQAAATVAKLRRSGFRIIGTGDAGPGAKKIWFIRRGPIL